MGKEGTVLHDGGGEIARRFLFRVRRERHLQRAERGVRRTVFAVAAAKFARQFLLRGDGCFAVAGEWMWIKEGCPRDGGDKIACQFPLRGGG